MSLTSLIEDYGYLALLIGTFLEGETILVLAGFAAQRGHLEIQWVIVVAFLGSFSGDQLFFYIGRRYGTALIARRATWRVRAEKVYRLIERHQNFLILTFRFYYGLRSVTPFALGAEYFGRFAGPADLSETFRESRGTVWDDVATEKSARRAKLRP